ncbi:MAG: OmpA family protein [Allomuricauda sp.]|nr:MAG: OmpA family protein [Allomuricauda sp.]
MKVSKLYIPFVMAFLACATTWGQGKRSKGDAFFFQYAYGQAVQAYEAEMSEKGLSPLQKLNLADAYFQTSAYQKASELYFEMFKQDSLMGNHHFNKMLQSFSNVGDRNRVLAVLETKSTELGQELLENADFNLELLQSEDENGLDFELFNVASNSPQSDFSPAFFGDKLLFSSGRPQEKKPNYAPMGESFLDIYVGRIGNDKQILNPNPFDGIPQSDYHKATPYFSESLNSLLYVLSNTDKGGKLAFDDRGKNALAIGMQNIDGPFRLILRDLSTSFYYPFYDEQTGKLYFAANFEDSYGGTDIYFIYTNNGQVMSAPINLGPRVNSPGNEIAPYIFENSLYFASDVFYGLGGMDIYRSNIEDEENFSIPVNLGPKVNSAKDDFGFIMRDDGEGLLGYFSSNRDGGKGKDDIYGFKVAQKPGLQTITLRGVVAKPDTKATPIGKAAVRLLDKEGNLLKETYSSADGSYRIEIPWRDAVILQAKKDRHSTFTEELQFVTGSDQETNFKVDVDLAYYNDLIEEKEGQKVVKLNKFYFGRNRTELNPIIIKELDKVVDFVKHFPQVQLRIETYTDSRGGSSTNYRLTKGRSDAIKKYLIDNGVSASNVLYSMGFGEEKLLNNCTNGAFCIEIMHQQNQRSLIVVLNDNLLFQ